MIKKFIIQSGEQTVFLKADMNTNNCWIGGNNHFEDLMLVLLENIFKFRTNRLERKQFSYSIIRYCFKLNKEKLEQGIQLMQENGILVEKIQKFPERTTS